MCRLRGWWPALTHVTLLRAGVNLLPHDLWSCSLKMHALRTCGSLSQNEEEQEPKVHGQLAHHRATGMHAAWEAPSWNSIPHTLVCSWMAGDICERSGAGLQRFPLRSLRYKPRICACQSSDTECSFSSMLVPLTKNSVTMVSNFRIISVIPPLLTSMTLTDTQPSFVSWSSLRSISNYCYAIRGPGRCCLTMGPNMQNKRESFLSLITVSLAWFLFCFPALLILLTGAIIWWPGLHGTNCG